MTKFLKLYEVFSVKLYDVFPEEERSTEYSMEITANPVAFIAHTPYYIE